MSYSWAACCAHPLAVVNHLLNTSINGVGFTALGSR